MASYLTFFSLKFISFEYKNLPHKVFVRLLLKTGFGTKEVLSK
jgi:hypothetical protein